MVYFYTMDSQERRIFRRLPCSLRAVIGGKEVTCLDICPGGFKLRLKEKLLPGSFYEIIIYGKKTIKIKSRLAWIKEDEEGLLGGFSLNYLQFIGISNLL